MLLFPLLAVVLLQSERLYAESPAHDYDHVANHYFWGDLYSQGGWSFYCGYRFDGERRTDGGKYMDIDHIYSIGWMLKTVDCTSRLDCFEAGNSNFMEMESDLHNMYPVWSNLVILRDDRPFGEVGGEEWRFGDCDIEWDSNHVEPRAIARGNIARAIFYMHDTYGLVIPSGMLATLKAWNREDPPSTQEKYRNDRIEQLQGRRNRFIDNPSLAEGLSRNGKPR